MIKNAVILAGGKSSRMGQDKALLPFGGYETVTEYQYRRLSTIFEKVFISTKEDKFTFAAPLIYDASNDSSPLQALAAIFKEIKEPFFLLSVDLPLLDVAYIKELIKLYTKEPQFSGYFFKSSNGIEPTAGIYTAKYEKSVLEQLANNNHKLQDLLQKEPFTTLSISDPKSFLNMNNPKEYQKAIDLFEG